MHERKCTLMSEPLDHPDPLKRRNPQCTAKSKRSGERCQRPAMNGTNVCRNHGGAAPQVRAKAQRRLQAAADNLAKQLLHMATGAESETVKLAAIRDALDRAGLKAQTTVDVQVSTAPWQELMGGIAPMTRAESRAARGLPTGEPSTPEPSRPVAVRMPGTEDVVDAEVVPLADDPETSPHRGGSRLPADERGNGTPPPAQPGTGLMTFEDAQEELRRSTYDYNMRNQRR